jgi:16S rRNA (cytosine967-C5)-methyltransferase
VNAVLRRIAREDWTAPTDADGLGMAYSHPDWLVNRWIRTFGRERTRLLLVHNNTQPTITLQPARWSASRLAEALESNGVNVARRQAGGPAYGFELQDHRQVSSLPGYDEGAFVVQDSSQRRLLEFAAFPADIMIWDACAAPGGKAVTLAARGPVVASDPSPSRLKRLRENVDRVAPSVRLFRADARQPPLAGGSMRGVLVDAPCSATGTIARHPDARWRVSARRIRTLCRLQAEILDGAAGIVAPRGLLVYFTCSLEPEENHMQVDQFLERHTAFERDGDDVLIFPPDHRSDGGFGARLRRAA